MSSGLDLLGAVSTSLSGQYITLRVKSVDADVLKSKLGGGTGSIAAASLHFVDAAPRAALDTAAPFIVKAAKDYGVDADIQVSNKAPGDKRAISEFWPGLLVGVVIGGSSLVLWKAFAALVNKIASR